MTVVIGPTEGPCKQSSVGQTKALYGLMPWTLRRSYDMSILCITIQEPDGPNSPNCFQMVIECQIAIREPDSPNCSKWRLN